MYGNQVDCILEVKNDTAKGVNEVRYQNALRRIGEASIGGNPVLAAIELDRGKKASVPCFGHGSNCVKDNGCKSPQPHGVTRYFGLTLVFKEPVDFNVFGSYKINPYAEIRVCSVIKAFDGERIPLETPAN